MAGKRFWFVPVVSIAQSYVTKRGKAVGVAKLRCGHEVLANMEPPRVRRWCFACERERRIVHAVPGGPDAR